MENNNVLQFRRKKPPTPVVKNTCMYMARMVIYVIAFIILITCLSACTHVTYDSTQSAEKIEKLQKDNSALKAALEDCNKDMGKCMDLLKDCQPLVK